MLDNFARTPIPGSEHRKTGRHGLDNCQPKCLKSSWLYKNTAPISHMPIQFTGKVLFQPSAEPAHLPIQFVFIHDSVHMVDFNAFLVVRSEERRVGKECRA